MLNIDITHSGYIDNDHTLGAVVMDGTFDFEEVDRMRAVVQDHSLESIVAEYGLQTGMVMPQYTSETHILQNGRELAWWSVYLGRRADNLGQLLMVDISGLLRRKSET